MRLPDNHFFASNNQCEIQCAMVGQNRWIVASSVGRAVGLSEPKSFAKAVMKKPALKDWKETLISKDVTLNRDEQFYLIERRVLSASLAAFIVAHMRLSAKQVAVFRFLITLTNLGFDMSFSARSMDEIKEMGINHGISFH